VYAASGVQSIAITPAVSCSYACVRSVSILDITIEEVSQFGLQVFLLQVLRP
jgi:hypothetical protein